MDARSLTDEQIYWQLVDVTGAQVAGDGEAHCACPACGKEAKRGQTHFSFSLRGGKCMVCGQAWGLRALARQVLGEGTDRRYVRAYHEPAPVKERAPFAVDSWERALVSYTARLEERIEAWRAYAPTLPERVILQRELCVGRMLVATSKCRHERLLVPMRVGGRLVGIRSRAVGCDCGKWLSALGSRMVLYNGAVLLRKAARGHGQPDDIGDTVREQTAGGRWLWVVENPIDALLLEERYPDACAVATLGVSMWRDGWTALVRAAAPLGVVVAYDNDAPGNVTPGCAGAIARSWGEEHQGKPPANGNRLVNRLLVAGVKARLFAWPAGTALKADVGDMLRKGGNSNE